MADLTGMREAKELAQSEPFDCAGVSNKVVPESEMDDPLIIRPPKAIPPVGHTGREIEFHLDQNVDHRWVDVFHRIQYTSSLGDHIPPAFRFAGDRAYIRSTETNPQTIQIVANFFKQYVDQANRDYSENLRREREAERREQEEAIRQEREELQRRLALKEAVKGIQL